MGQPWISSLAIAGRFLFILPDSSIKTEDRRTCISQMVDSPKRKQDFRVRTWSGAFWEPLERKKKRKPNVFTRFAILCTAPNSKNYKQFHQLPTKPRHCSRSLQNGSFCRGLLLNSSFMICQSNSLNNSPHPQCILLQSSGRGSCTVR